MARTRCGELLTQIYTRVDAKIRAHEYCSYAGGFVFVFFVLPFHSALMLVCAYMYVYVNYQYLHE